MSKKKEPKKLSHPSSDENNLTPWQKANRKYLAEQEMKNQEPKKEDITLDKKSTAQSTISSVSFDHHCIGYTADFFDLLCFSL